MDVFNVFSGLRAGSIARISSIRSTEFMKMLYEEKIAGTFKVLVWNASLPVQRLISHKSRTQKMASCFVSYRKCFDGVFGKSVAKKNHNFAVFPLQESTFLRKLPIFLVNVFRSCVTGLSLDRITTKLCTTVVTAVAFPLGNSGNNLAIFLVTVL